MAVFLNIWVSKYVRFSDCAALDQGSKFSIQEFRRLLSSVGILLQPSGVESHNALVNSERYHDYLRNVYRKILDDIPKLNGSDVLSLAIKSVNYSAGRSGLFTTLLVFGVLTRLPIYPKDLPYQRDLMRAMLLTRT